MLLVALPVRVFDCSFVQRLTQPTLILMAGGDEFGTLRELRELFPTLPPTIETDEIPHVNHYFETATQELQARVRAWAQRSLANRP